MKVKGKIVHFTILALLTSLAITGIGIQLPLVQGNPFTPTQIVNPFTEMQPGVYVAWEWWNESGGDYSYPIDPGYYTDLNSFSEANFLATPTTQSATRPKTKVGSTFQKNKNTTTNHNLGKSTTQFGCL